MKLTLRDVAEMDEDDFIALLNSNGKARKKLKALLDFEDYVEIVEQFDLMQALNNENHHPRWF